MTDNNFDVTSAIVEFCKRHCKSVAGIMVFGSYVDGTHTNLSDVDVIIIDEAEVVGKKVQDTVWEYPVQATITDFKLLVNLLMNSKVDGNFFYPNSINNSSILMDPKGFCEYLKNVAEEIVANGPPARIEANLELRRISISNFLNDGSNEKYVGAALAEKMLWANRVIMMCHDYILYSENDWNYTNFKLKKNILAKNYTQIYQSLNKILEDFVVEQDSAIFSEKVKNSMAQFMNFSWNSSAPNHCSIV